MDTIRRNNSNMHFSHSFNDAMKIDKAIYQLAAYDSSNGMIVIPETTEKSLEFQKGIINKFNYFKRLIQNGEVSLIGLQDMVLSRSGPYESKGRSVSVEKMVDDLIEKSIVPNASSLEADYLENGEIASLMKKIFSDISSVTGKEVDLRPIKPHKLKRKKDKLI